jgi:hypothetical protein
MTRKEAIKILKSMSDISTQGEAIDMAIEALQEVDELEKIIKELADEDYKRQLWRDYKSLL